MSGCVAAGHPLTAEAGARVLGEGGNAVDAAIASVLASLVTESPLTGLGAGGYMLVHGFGDDSLLDFFVAFPGRDGRAPTAELEPVEVRFTEDITQVFNVGAASCGVPGTPAGLEEAGRRWGSAPISELGREAAALARGGVRINSEQAYFVGILAPILARTAEGQALYAPEGRPLREGEVFRFPDLADAIELLGTRGAEPFYRGSVAARVSEWVLERGGTLGPDDLSSYVPELRDPVVARFRGREVLSNPPPSSGGVLIAYALELLERLGACGVEDVVRVMEEAQSARTEDFAQSLRADGFVERFLDPGRLDEAAERVARRLVAPPGGGATGADRLGSTTHITAVDGEGRCASVTCSNGTGSGLVVPGTGIHVNNMLGEEDLNPLGFHRYPPGVRLPSMMAPTVVLADGSLEAALGSGGSNRIRSAILQTILRIVVDGTPVERAVRAPRLHFESGAVQAEPGLGESELRRLEERGLRVVRWRAANVFFGGAHAVARDPATGELRGGGDPRRGGAVAYG